MGDQFSLGLRCTVSPDLRKTTFGPRVYSLQRIAGFQLPPSKADALPNLPRAFQGGGTETRQAQGDDRGQSKHLTGGVVTINGIGVLWRPEQCVCFPRGSFSPFWQVMFGRLQTPPRGIFA